MDSPKPPEPLCTSTTSRCLPRPKSLNGIKHFINDLQLRKMVAPTKGSQSVVELRGVKFRYSQNLFHVALPGMLQFEAKIVPMVELDVTLAQVGFEQGHAAPDVSADEVRIDEPHGQEGCTNRAAFAWMQIRKTDRQAHSFKFRNGVELAKRLAFDPAVARGEEAHIAFCQCGPFTFLPVEAGFWFQWGVVPEFRTPRIIGPGGWYRANVSSSSGRR